MEPNKTCLVISASIKPMACLICEERIFAPDENASLPAQIESVCRQASVKLSDIPDLYVDVGPGSFTGARIACAIAKGFGLLGMDIFTFSSLDLGAHLSPHQGQFIVLLDARRDNVYLGKYEKREVLTRLTQPALVFRDSLNHSLPIYELKEFSVDDMAEYVLNNRPFQKQTAFLISPVYLYPMDCSIRK